jgi:hypothetical protein
LKSQCEPGSAREDYPLPLRRAAAGDRKKEGSAPVEQPLGRPRAEALCVPN